jgi:HTH-type transcriptional regulator / antitoxin HipB
MIVHPERDFAASVGERIRKERELQGLRQDQLAFAAGVSPRLVHQVEAGKPTTRIDGLVKILQALGLTLEVVTRPLRREVRMSDDPDLYE